MVSIKLDFSLLFQEIESRKHLTCYKNNRILHCRTQLVVSTEVFEELLLSKALLLTC